MALNDKLKNFVGKLMADPYNQPGMETVAKVGNGERRGYRPSAAPRHARPEDVAQETAAQQPAETGYQDQVPPQNQQTGFGQTGYQQPGFQQTAYQQQLAMTGTAQQMPVDNTGFNTVLQGKQASQGGIGALWSNLVGGFRHTKGQQEDPQAQTGYQAPMGGTGYQPPVQQPTAPYQTGYQGQPMGTGYQSPVNGTGYQAPVQPMNTGYQTGYQGQPMGTGYQSPVNGTSYQAPVQPMNPGYTSQFAQPSVNTGYQPQFNNQQNNNTSYQPQFGGPQPNNTGYQGGSTAGSNQGYTPKFGRTPRSTQENQPKPLGYVGNTNFVDETGTAYAMVVRVAQPLTTATCYRIIEFMRNGESVLVNTEMIKDPAELTRCLDLLFGAAFAMHATYTRIASRSIYLITPRSVKVMPYASVNDLHLRDNARTWPGSERDNPYDNTWQQDAAAADRTGYSGNSRRRYSSNRY